QKTLEREHNMRFTYMEMRLIASDLEVNWKKQDGTDKVEEEATDEAGEEGDAVQAEAVLEGETQISISKIVRPGAMMSGDVVFKSGKRAEWYVDNMGRLGLNPADESENPDEEDLQDFQVKLQEQIQSSGGGF
ncbi:hypothetical protein BVY04_04380, partial [bacterium M21]